MGYKQTVGVSILAGALAAGGGVAGHSYIVRDNVKIEATVNLDEKKLGQEISANLIKHQEDQKAYQLKLAQRKGCYQNRDNEYYLKQHCDGVTF